MAVPYEQFGEVISSIGQGLTGYACLGTGGLANASSTESSAQTTVQYVHTLSNMRTYVTSNTLSGNLTMTVRKNAADGASTVTYATTITGAMQDLTHSDSFVAGDAVDLKQLAVAGTGTASISTLGFTNTPTSTQTTLYISSRPSGRAYTVNSTVNPIYLADGLDAGIVETSQQTTWRVAGTIANFAARSSANTRTTGDVTCGIRKNGVSGANLVTFTTGAEYKQDLTHTDSLVSGDLVNGHLTTGTGTGTFTYALQSFEFTTSTTTNQVVTSGGNGYAVNSTNYTNISGLQVGKVLAADAQFKIFNPGTLSNLRAYVVTNLNTGTTLVNLHKNSAIGTQTISYGSGATLFQEDTTHTDSVVSGDLVCYQVVTGATGTGSISIGNLAMNLLYPSGAAVVVKQLAAMGVG